MNTPGAKAYRPWTPELYAQQAHAPAAKLPEDDLVFFLIDVVPKLDLSKIHAPYQDESRGAPPFDPAMMVCLLLYGYCGKRTGNSSFATAAILLGRSPSFNPGASSWHAPETPISTVRGGNASSDRAQAVYRSPRSATRGCIRPLVLRLEETDSRPVYFPRPPSRLCLSRSSVIRLPAKSTQFSVEASKWSYPTKSDFTSTLYPSPNG